MIEDLHEAAAQHAHTGGLHRVHALHGRQVRDETGQVVRPVAGAAGVDVEQADDAPAGQVDLPLVEVPVRRLDARLLIGDAAPASAGSWVATTPA